MTSRPGNQNSERLQKFLAACGVASRRHAEELIQQGRIEVNGEVVTQLGTRVDPEQDHVSVDGRPVRRPAAHHYLLLHKPAGYITSASDERGRATVLDLVGETPGRLFPVGRLDRDSEGLLLLTDDGELAQRLMHPRYGLQREYRVLLAGTLSEEGLARLRSGTVVQGRPIAPLSVEAEPEEPTGRSHPRFWVRIVVTEGRKREVRELAAAVGYTVHRLIRIRYGPLHLGRLPSGAFRPLTSSELAALRREVGLGRQAGRAGSQVD